MGQINLHGAAVVTGCCGEIGADICTYLKDSGMQVIGIDQQSQAAIQYDLSQLSTGEDDSLLTQITEQAYGQPIRLLVNNAAVQVLGQIDQLSVAEFNRSLAINLVAPYALSKMLFPALKASQGSIINIGSVHTRQTKQGFLAYSVSKTALSGLTRALALESPKQVRVNQINPAAINTGMLREGFEDQSELLKALGDFHPVGRIGKPNEVSALVAFLASSEAGFVNGAEWSLDGGISSVLHDPAN